MIPDLLRQPAARAVLDRYGLRGVAARDRRRRSSFLPAHDVPKSLLRKFVHAIAMPSEMPADDASEEEQLAT